jgi:hypothetical protein
LFAVHYVCEKSSLRITRSCRLCRSCCALEHYAIAVGGQ